MKLSLTMHDKTHTVESEYEDFTLEEMLEMFKGICFSATYQPKSWENVILNMAEDIKAPTPAAVDTVLTTISRPATINEPATQQESQNSASETYVTIHGDNCSPYRRSASGLWYACGAEAPDEPYMRDGDWHRVLDALAAARAEFVAMKQERDEA